jgi:glycosyltransferase involved in cell wall biosynthesis
VRRALGALRMRERPLVWAFLPTWLGVARRLQAHGLVYHCVDRYSANPGVDRARVEAAEDEMLREADRVLVTSPVLLDHVRGRRPDAVCVPNVADVALFSRAAREPLSEPRALVGLPRPRVVYTGNLARYRIDFDLLGGLADALPEICFVLVGAVGLGDPGGAAEAFAALEARPNVRAFAAVDQAVLPDWLGHVDVALIPFLDNEHTRASLPLKLWEYVAAGLPVVATELPHFAALAAEGTVRTASGVDGFVAALRAALAEPSEGRPERAQRATGHDWEARIDELLQLVGNAGGEGGVR